MKNNPQIVVAVLCAILIAFIIHSNLGSISSKIDAALSLQATK